MTFQFGKSPCRMPSAALTVCSANCAKKDTALHHSDWRYLRFWLRAKGIPAQGNLRLGKSRFPPPTIATVYKTLAVLKSIGEVLELEFSSDYNRYDGKKPGPHPHLICIKCKRIVDPDLKSLTEMTEKLASKPAISLSVTGWTFTVSALSVN